MPSPWPIKHKVCPACSGCVLTPLGVSYCPGRWLMVPRQETSVELRVGTTPNTFARFYSQVKSGHLYLYSAFNNTNCVKATAQYQNRKKF